MVVLGGGAVSCERCTPVHGSSLVGQLIFVALITNFSVQRHVLNRHFDWIAFEVPCVIFLSCLSAPLLRHTVDCDGSDVSGFFKVT